NGSRSVIKRAAPVGTKFWASLWSAHPRVGGPSRSSTPAKVVFLPRRKAATSTTYGSRAGLNHVLEQKQRSRRRSSVSVSHRYSTARPLGPSATNAPPALAGRATSPMLLASSLVQVNCCFLAPGYSDAGTRELATLAGGGLSGSKGRYHMLGRRHHQFVAALDPHKLVIPAGTLRFDELFKPSAVLSFLSAAAAYQNTGDMGSVSQLSGASAARADFLSPTAVVPKEPLPLRIGCYDMVLECSGVSSPDTHLLALTILPSVPHTASSFLSAFLPPSSSSLSLAPLESDRHLVPAVACTPDLCRRGRSQDDVNLLDSTPAAEMLGASSSCCLRERPSFESSEFFCPQLPQQATCFPCLGAGSLPPLLYSSLDDAISARSILMQFVPRFVFINSLDVDLEIKQADVGVPFALLSYFPPGSGIGNRDPQSDRCLDAFYSASFPSSSAGSSRRSSTLEDHNMTDHTGSRQRGDKSGFTDDELSASRLLFLTPSSPILFLPKGAAAVFHFSDPGAPYAINIRLSSHSYTPHSSTLYRSHHHPYGSSYQAADPTGTGAVHVENPLLLPHPAYEGMRLLDVLHEEGVLQSEERYYQDGAAAAVATASASEEMTYIDRRVSSSPYNWRMRDGSLLQPLGAGWDFPQGHMSGDEYGPAAGFIFSSSAGSLRERRLPGGSDSGGLRGPGQKMAVECRSSLPEEETLPTVPDEVTSRLRGSHTAYEGGKTAVTQLGWPAQGVLDKDTDDASCSRHYGDLPGPYIMDMEPHLRQLPGIADAQPGQPGFHRDDNLSLWRGRSAETLTRFSVRARNGGRGGTSSGEGTENTRGKSRRSNMQPSYTATPGVQRPLSSGALPEQRYEPYSASTGYENGERLYLSDKFRHRQHSPDRADLPLTPSQQPSEYSGRGLRRATFSIGFDRRRSRGARREPVVSSSVENLSGASLLKSGSERDGAAHWHGSATQDRSGALWNASNDRPLPSGQHARKTQQVNNIKCLPLLQGSTEDSLGPLASGHASLPCSLVSGHETGTELPLSTMLSRVSRSGSAGLSDQFGREIFVPKPRRGVVAADDVKDHTDNSGSETVSRRSSQAALVNRALSGEELARRLPGEDPAVHYIEKLASWRSRSGTLTAHPFSRQLTSSVGGSSSGLSLLGLRRLRSGPSSSSEPGSTFEGSSQESDSSGTTGGGEMCSSGVTSFSSGSSSRRRSPSVPRVAPRVCPPLPYFLWTDAVYIAGPAPDSGVFSRSPVSSRSSTANHRQTSPKANRSSGALRTPSSQDVFSETAPPFCSSILNSCVPQCTGGGPDNTEGSGNSLSVSEGTRRTSPPEAEAAAAQRSCSQSVPLLDCLGNLFAVIDTTINNTGSDRGGSICCVTFSAARHAPVHVENHLQSSYILVTNKAPLCFTTAAGRAVGSSGGSDSPTILTELTGGLCGAAATPSPDRRLESSPGDEAWTGGWSEGNCGPAPVCIGPLQSKPFWMQRALPLCPACEAADAMATAAATAAAASAASAASADVSAETQYLETGAAGGQTERGKNLQGRKLSSGRRKLGAEEGGRPSGFRFPDERVKAKARKSSAAAPRESRWQKWRKNSSTGSSASGRYSRAKQHTDETGSSEEGDATDPHQTLWDRGGDRGGYPRALLRFGRGRALWRESASDRSDSSSLTSDSYNSSMGADDSSFPLSSTEGGDSNSTTDRLFSRLVAKERSRTVRGDGDDVSDFLWPPPALRRLQEQLSTAVEKGVEKCQDAAAAAADIIK
ncbi:amine-terminal region of a tm vesicle-mediated sorter, partial [Cystoisospora suis]